MSKGDTKLGRLEPLNRDAVSGQLDHLITLDAVELRTLWPDHFGVPPPPRMRRDMLTRIIAHEVQARAYGGISKSATKALDRVAAVEFGELDDKRPRSTERRLAPGARLVREWRGTTHEVCVMEKGFAWSGRTYRSLSAVAHAITGTRWNGPAFFGLRSKAEP